MIDSMKIFAAKEYWKNDPNMSDKWTRFLWDHAMYRPKKYRSFYKSVESLMEASAGKIVKYRMGDSPPTALFSSYSSLEQAVEEAQMPLHHLHDALNAMPLLREEVIAQYTGSKGKVIWFICDEKYYRKLTECRPTMRSDPSGYIQVVYRGQSSRSLHADIMDRYLAYDGTVIDHRNGCRVDDRSRNLRVVSYKTNARNLNFIKGYIQRGNKWRISILINSKPWRVSMDTEYEAKFGRKFLTENIEFVERMVVSESMSGASLAKWLKRKLEEPKVTSDGVMMSSPVKPMIVSPVVEHLAVKRRRLEDGKIPVKFTNPPIITVVAARHVIAYPPKIVIAYPPKMVVGKSSPSPYTARVWGLEE
jgi:hypothetical protein